MPWIEKGDVVSARVMGNTIDFAFKTISHSRYPGYIFLESGEAENLEKYYKRFKSPQDGEVYDAIGEYLRTH